VASWLPDDVIAAYAAGGITEPWQHQLEAAELARSGEHVALATGTASGKSIGFGMPALAAIHAGASAPDGRGATVIYLSPTKALANDQLRALERLALPWLRAATYDGDTPSEERACALPRQLRAHQSTFCTTRCPRPSALVGVLRRLHVIVIDEAHAYRGVLGSHVAEARLRRVAAHTALIPW
jgi:DEAD/DEAH box helicase domain-containing protein